MSYSVMKASLSHPAFPMDASSQLSEYDLFFGLV